jgi:spermidine/putrescine transport system substrate-binding protein
MKRTVTGLGTAILLAWSAQGAAAEGSLAVYNWGDYINPEVLDRFAEEFGVKVTLDTYGSNEEMLAKIQAGATGYDIVFPSVHMHDIMAKLDLLEKTDVNRMPGWENIDRAHLLSKTDPNGEYCLPYAWGSVGIMYNKNRVPEIKSWQDYFAFAAENPGSVILLDDMREVLGVGLILNGKSVNSRDAAEIEQAGETILKQKANVGAFSYDVIPLIQSGDMAAAHYFVGAMMYVLEDPENLAYVIPEEGATMYQEDICVLKSAPNKENARKFLEFYMRPEIAALNAAQQKNGTTNTKARELLPAELRDNPYINPPAEVMKKLQIFEDLGEDLRTYDRVWTKVKTN